MYSRRSQLDQEMQSIRDDLLRLASLVDRAIDGTFRAFVSHDDPAAVDVINADDAIDQLHEKIEHQVEITVALQQPAASDLRALIASLLISTELERMGDHAEGIARTVVRDTTDRPEDVPASLFGMRDLARRMLRDAMDAFVGRDVEKARAVAAVDAQVDELYKKLFDELITRMSSGALRVERGTYLLWTGHNLERICDRTTNICERVIYMRTGDVGNLNVKAAGEGAE